MLKALGLDDELGVQTARNLANNATRAGLDADGRLIRRKPLGAKPESPVRKQPSRLARLSCSGRLCLTPELRGTELGNLWAWVVGDWLWLSSSGAMDSAPVRLRHPAHRPAAVEAVLTGAPIRPLLHDAGIRLTGERVESVPVLVESVGCERQELLLRVSRAEVVRAWH